MSAEGIDLLPERVRSKIQVTDSCWLWTGAILTTGYATVRWGGRMVRAHRLVKHLIDDPSIVLCPGNGSNQPLDHLCRTRNCVRPKHLEVVSARENVIRGRSSLLGDHASLFVGVSRRAAGGDWKGTIREDGQIRHLGFFPSELAAAYAYDDAAERICGERTNDRLGLMSTTTVRSFEARHRLAAERTAEAPS